MGMPMEQLEMMVCVADENRDGKMSVTEFEVIFAKMRSGDMSWIQEAQEHCLPQALPGFSVLIPY